MMVDATQMMNEIDRAQRIGYTRYLGACPACGTGIARASGARTAICEGCGASVVLKAVDGVFSDKTPCDDRCQYAIGDSCECACSGTNHGAGYIAPVGERPQWVTERDAARHQAKMDRAAAKEHRARQAVEDVQAALIEQYPALARLAEANDGSDFMDDMARAFESGKMTDRPAAKPSSPAAPPTRRAASKSPAPSGQFRTDPPITGTTAWTGRCWSKPTRASRSG